MQHLDTVDFTPTYIAIGIVKRIPTKSEMSVNAQLKLTETEK